MRRPFLSSILISLLASGSVLADPGMWPFDLIPREEIKRKYGFEVTDAFVDLMKYSMARMNVGGSGAFVSPDGLLMTNHHVAQPALRQISKPGGFNYSEHGFTAQSLSEEIRIPSYEVNAFMGLEDVTDRVNAKVTPEMTAYQAMKARERAIAEIEEEYFEATGAKPEVKGLYRGTVFHLYKFKRYRDVRLVWAPEKQAGFYGDDEANFHYPRYALDTALFRVYDEEGNPVKTPYYLPVSPYGSTEGELLFVAGNPGTTKRHFSSTEMAFERDVVIPFTIAVLEGRERAMMRAKTNADPEIARMAGDDLFSIQNGLKVYRGMAENFTTNSIVENKAALESAWAQELEKLGRADEWTEALALIDSAQKAYGELYEQLTSMGSIGLNSKYFGHASILVGIAEERLKDNLDRAPTYRRSNRPSLDLNINSTEPIYGAFEKVKLIQSLTWAVERFGDRLPKFILDGKTVEARAEELSQSVILGDPKKRRELFDALEAGTLSLDQIQDPWIPLVRKLRIYSKQLEEQIENEINGPTQRGFQKILELRRALGHQVYPDASFSPRVTFGVVKSYVDHGVTLPAYTTMEQAFVQAESRDNRGFWELPKSWWDAKAAGRIDGSTPLNFVAELDTIGGNSGSPVINIHGHWVGILFDGTRFTSGQVTHAEPNPKIGRSLMVDCRAALKAIDGIYQARYVVQELRSAWDSFTMPRFLAP